MRVVVGALVRLGVSLWCRLRRDQYGSEDSVSGLWRQQRIVGSIEIL